MSGLSIPGCPGVPIRASSSYGRKAAACFLRYGPWVFRIGGLGISDLVTFAVVPTLPSVPREVTMKLAR